MNKSDLCARFAEAAAMPRNQAAAVTTVFSATTEALTAGDTVVIAGFGTFRTRNRAARHGRNPQTGESIAIPTSNTPAFKPGKALHDAVSQEPQPTAHLASCVTAPHAPGPADLRLRRASPPVHTQSTVLHRISSCFSA